jgi:hypothetical protein
VKEYDLFIPLYYNDGSPIESQKLHRLQTILSEQFDGLTFFPQPNKGHWKMGGVTYRDDIVIYRVLTGNTRRARQFLAKLKHELKHDLQQEDVLIVEREVETL